MKAHKILIGVLALVLLCSLASAIPQDSITITGPATGTWTNLTNYTSGFAFSWTDNEGTYGATCSLHIGSANNVALLLATGNGTYVSQDVVQDTATTLYMNHTFPTNNTANYWTIKCLNSSHLPWTATTPRLLKQDVTTPEYTITSTGFTNNTWTTSPVRFDVTSTDDETQGEEITVKLVNTTGTKTWGTGAVANGTAENLTFALSDGQYIVSLSFLDPALNTNKSTEAYTINVDSVDPAVSYNSPANDYVSTGNSVLLNWSITETNLDTIRLNWSGTPVEIESGNCTGTAPYVCAYNKTGIPATKDITWSIIVNDSAGNEFQTASRIVNVDLESPGMTTIYNLTFSDSVATYKATVTDTTPSSCVGQITDNAGNVTTVTGSWTYGNTTSNCTGTISSSDIVADGAFTFLWNVSDEATNRNQTETQTGVFNQLYSGWNLVTWADVASTSGNICSAVTSCSQIAWYNNTDNTYTSYSTSTPKTNNATAIAAGAAYLIYVTADTSVFMNDYLPNAGASAVNITLYDIGGWNTMGLTEDANISAVYNAENSVGYTTNITWASWYNADTGYFATCNRAGSCTGTTSEAANIDLPEGYAVWVLTDLDNNYTYDRSGVTG